MHIRNRVAQTTNSAGTGNLELNGTLDGFKTVAGSVDAASNKTFAVLVKDGDAWELFESYLITGSPNALFRGDLIGSSAIDGSRVELSNAANKPIYLVEPAETWGPMGGRSKFAVTEGTAPDYTAVFATPIRAPKTGTRCMVRFHAVNPASNNTFAPDGHPVKPLKFGRPWRAIAAGRILANMLATLEFHEVDDGWSVVSALPLGIVKTVSAATYTVLEEDHEITLNFTNAAGCAVAMPQATGQFAAPFWFDYIAAGNVTFTPATSTVNTLASFSAGAGQTGKVLADGGHYRATALGVGVVPAIAASARDLNGFNRSGAPNSQITYTATEIILKDAAAAARLVALSATADLSLTGISGLDTGSEAASTWYHLWAVDLTAPVTGAPVTATAATDRITHAAHGLAANTPVKIGGTAAPGGTTLGQIVYLRDVNAGDYKIAATPNGTAIDLTSTGTSVTISTVPGILFSLSATAPTLPSGYTFKAYLGPWYNDGSSNLRLMNQYGRETKFNRVIALSAGSPSVVATLQSLSIPTIIPPNAIAVSGVAGADVNGSVLSIQIAGNAAGIGLQHIASDWGAANLMDGLYSGGDFEVPILNTQAIHWTANVTGQTSIRPSGFKF